MSLALHRNRIKLSQHFELIEFEDPTTHTVMIDDRLVIAVETLRVLFDHPITVTSGYRTEEHNAAVGGVRNSRHLTGQAADLIGPEGLLDALYEHAATIKTLLAIREVDHVHVELAPPYVNP